MKNQILESINQIILLEIDKVNERYPSIYSKDDAITLLYMLNGRFKDAIESIKPEENTSTGEDVIQILEDLKETIKNHGSDIDLNEYVDLDFSNSYGGSYSIDIEVDSYNVTKEYVGLIDDYIGRYEERKQESKESQESDN